jgi:hypothetical protein
VHAATCARPCSDRDGWFPAKARTARYPLRANSFHLAATSVVGGPVQMS